MSTSTSATSRILLVLILIYSCAYANNVGDKCFINSVPGECKLLQDCSIVYEELLAGITPTTTCGFLHFEPIVCCPTSRPITTTTTLKPTTTTVQTTTVQTIPINRKRGTLARIKCAEAAEAVWGLEIPHTLSYNRVPVNVSRCAINIRKLIVGGEKADAKEFPHMTAIGFDGRENGIQWYCGGSLISDRIVLTAAHCTYVAEWGSAKWARVGDLNLVRMDDDAQPQTIRIIQRIKHPNYKPPAEYNDIAIMKLETAVTYDAWVRPACLPVNWPDVGDETVAIATGWGRIEADEDTSDDLLKVTINLISHESCNETYSDGGSNAQLPLGIIKSQMCAGQFGKDTCQGDSGGPLAIFSTIHKCMYNIIGITSIGRLCGSITPGVYTRVYNYIPWIEETAWPEYFKTS